MQRLPAIQNGETAVCARCDALLQRAGRGSLVFPRVTIALAAVLFVLALALPLVGLEVLGRSATSSVLSGPEVLSDAGTGSLAVVVVALLLVAPAVKLAVQIVVLFGVLASRPPKLLAWLYGWLDRLSPWAMIEVYLLGSFVAYTRLKALAHVHVGGAALALGGVTLCMAAADATMDDEAVWRALGGRPPEHRSSRRGSLGSTWALVLAAGLLYVPANLLPVMSVERMGKGGPTTILNGVAELAQNHLWPLAILVLFASIVVPVLKLGSLAVMLAFTQRRSAWRLLGRTRLFRWIRNIGRWSMLDIFGLAVLVGVVRFGKIATVLPGTGAIAFCAVVLLTMVATELFDPRRMWDAARDAPRGGGAHVAA